MLKRFLFIQFIFSFLLLYGEESIEQAIDKWQEVSGKEIVLFVNNTNKSQKIFNGTKKSPFKTIEAAFTYLSGLNKKDIKATIYITGSFTSKNVYVITIPTKIVGFDDHKNEDIEKKASSYITFEKNAGFVVASSYLFIEKCSISRREFIGEPRSVPVLYSSNSYINMKNVNLTVKEGGSIFRFIESNVNMQAMVINSNQNGYCNMIETIKSKLKIKDVKFNCNGRFVVSIDSSASFVGMDAINCNIKAHLFAIVLKANDGEANIKNSIFSVEGKYVTSEEAIIYSNQTKLDVKDLELKGFMRESKLKND